MVSHEVANLSAIIGYTQLLHTEVKEVTIARALETIERSIAGSTDR